MIKVKERCYHFPKLPPLILKLQRIVIRVEHYFWTKLHLCTTVKRQNFVSVTLFWCDPRDILDHNLCLVPCPNSISHWIGDQPKCRRLKFERSKDELPHPGYACVFRIALRFPSNSIGWLNQRKYWENPTQCGKRMHKRDVWTLI